eukprot:TRINITY_DN3050_c0_g1_i3.p1 TRINITY_DN3050_c0_g1~~TRINITY_DN3050_c0_g1_i3.p1  ORF type:complete len:931 (+),score=179.30 TRINITY_DN3050_c0_g1_i3:53-2845(+)
MEQKQLSWMQKQQTQNALLLTRKQSSSTNVPWAVTNTQVAEDSTKVSSDYLRQIYMTSFRSSHLPSSPVPQSPTIPRRVIQSKPCTQEATSPRESNRAISQPLFQAQIQPKSVASSQEHHRSLSVSLDQTGYRKTLDQPKPAALLSILDYGDDDDDEEIMAMKEADVDANTVGSQPHIQPTPRLSKSQEDQTKAAQYTTSVARLPYGITGQQLNQALAIIESDYFRKMNTADHNYVDKKSTGKDQNPKINANSSDIPDNRIPDALSDQSRIEKEQFVINHEDRPAIVMSPPRENIKLESKDSTQVSVVNTDILTEMNEAIHPANIIDLVGHDETNGLDQQFNPDEIVDGDEHATKVDNKSESNEAETVIGDADPDMQEAVDWMDAAKELPSSGDMGYGWARNDLEELHALITPPTNEIADKHSSVPTHAFEELSFMSHTNSQAAGDDVIDMNRHCSGDIQLTTTQYSSEKSHLDTFEDQNRSEQDGRSYSDQGQVANVCEWVEYQCTNEPPQNTSHFFKDPHLNTKEKTDNEDSNIQVELSTLGVDAELDSPEISRAGAITKCENTFPIGRTSLCVSLHEAFEKEEIYAEHYSLDSPQGGMVCIDQMEPNQQEQEENIAMTNQPPQQNQEQLLCLVQATSPERNEGDERDCLESVQSRESENETAASLVGYMLPSPQSNAQTPEAAVVPIETNELVSDSPAKEEVSPVPSAATIGEIFVGMSQNPTVEECTVVEEKKEGGQDYQLLGGTEDAHISQDGETQEPSPKRRKIENESACNAISDARKDCDDIRQNSSDLDMRHNQDRLCPLSSVDPPHHRFEDAAVQTGISQREKDAIRIQILDWIKTHRTPISLNQIRVEADNQLPDLESWLEDLVAAGILKCKALHQSKQTQVTLYQYQGNPKPLKSALSTPKKDGKVNLLIFCYDDKVFL